MLNNNPQERYDKLLLSIHFKSTQKFIASILSVSPKPWVDPILPQKKVLPH
jgi:hypothetical protein